MAARSSRGSGSLGLGYASQRPDPTLWPRDARLAALPRAAPRLLLVRAGLGATTEVAWALPVQAAAAPWLGPARGPLCHRGLTWPLDSARSPSAGRHQSHPRAAAGQLPWTCSVRTD